MSEQHQQVRRWCDEQKSGGRSLSVHFSGLDALSLSMTFTEVEEELARHGSLRHSLVQAEAPEDVAAPAEAAPEAAPPQAPPEAPVAAPKDRSLAASLVSAGALAAPPAVAAPVQPAPAPSERYEVMHALHGGMGVVYICYDHELDFAFAIKTFRKDAFVDRPDVLLSFLNETEIWTELRPQSNVVRAFGTRLIGSTPFLFLELVQGRNLRELLASTSLSPAEAVEGGLMLCRALRHVWQCSPGLVHGDLKPSNVLVEGRILKVTDFGLAQNAAEGVAAGGTPAYMAPEQFKQESLSQKTDIYALGLLLYEMVAGKKPFEADSIAAYRIAHEATPAPFLELPARWRPLADLVAACLRKPAALRPTLEEVEERLRALRDEKSTRLLRDFGEDICHYFGGARTTERIQGALGFGEQFSGGVEEAVGLQLDELLAAPAGPATLARLRSLSELRERSGGAFAGWTARDLDVSALLLRGENLDAIYAPELRLSGADLQGSSLRDTVLRKADLSGADLRDADLSGADLSGADLRDADLRGATLDNARLRGSDLRGARLEGATIVGAVIEDANLARADLRGLDLSKRALKGCDLSEAVLEGARLQACLLEEVRLDGTVLRGASLVGAHLAGAFLRDVDLTGADLTRATLRAAELDGCDLRGADFQRALLEDATLRHCLAEGARFAHTQLRRTRWRDVDARGVAFERADLRFARFDDVDLHGSSLVQCKLMQLRADAATRWPEGSEELLRRRQGLFHDAPAALELQRDGGGDRSEALWVARGGAAPPSLSALLERLQALDPGSPACAVRDELGGAPRKGCWALVQPVAGQLVCLTAGRARVQRLRDGQVEVCCDGPATVVTPRPEDVYVLTTRRLPSQRIHVVCDERGAAFARGASAQLAEEAGEQGAVALLWVRACLNAFFQRLENAAAQLAFHPREQELRARTGGGELFRFDLTRGRPDSLGTREGALLVATGRGAVFLRSGRELLSLELFEPRPREYPMRALYRQGRAASDGSFVLLGGKLAAPDLIVVATGQRRDPVLVFGRRLLGLRDEELLGQLPTSDDVYRRRQVELGWLTGREGRRTGGLGLARALVRELWEAVAEGARGLAIGPECRSLALRRGEAVVWMRAGQPPRQLELPEGSELGRLELSPDGRWLVLRLWIAGDVRLQIHAVDRSFECREGASSHAGFERLDGPLAFSSRWLVSALGAQLTMWELETARVERRFREDCALTAVALSADDTYLAYGLEDGTVCWRYHELHQVPAEDG